MAERTEQEVRRIRERALREEARRNAVRMTGGGGGGGGPNMGYRMGYWSMRNFAPVTPMLSVAGRLAGDVARGAGVNFDIGSMIGTKIANEKQATEISNAGYIPSAKGEAGTRVDPSVIYKEAKVAADAAALSQEAALDGLRKFVDKTGDLKVGRDILGDLGKYARATGSSFEDMVSAAGDVSLGLGDVENKGEKVKAVMLAVAGQGKLGAVAMHDMASQMGKLAARAHEFRGGAVENIAMLGALAQEARMGGGAAKPAQATTAVGAFMDLFSKNARVKEYKNLTHHDLRDKAGMLGTPEELILEILRASKGDSQKIGSVVASAQARRVTRGFENIYREASGGGKDEKSVERGLAAVSGEFARLKAAAMNQKEVDDAFAESMKTTQAKAQLFQNQLQNSVDVMSTKLLPAMEQLAPQALKVFDAFGSLVSWAAGNPFESIVALLGVSITKAGIEQVLRRGIESVFSGANAKTSGVAGTAGAFLTIAAAATTMFEAGKMMIDAAMADKAKRQQADIGQELTAGNAASQLKHEIALGKVSKETLARAGSEAENIQAAAMRGGDKRDIGFTDQLVRGIARLGGSKDVVDKEDRDARKKQDEMLRESIELRQLIMRGITVNVRNMPDSGPAPHVNDNARSSELTSHP